MKRKEREESADEHVPDESGREATSFGTWLRRQREGREIDLREIADASKISLRYLQALEEDRFELLPAPVFAKGFLRQYAKYVGLDPEEVVNFFISAREAVERDKVTIEPRRKRRAANPWFYAVLVVLLAAGLLGVVWLLSFMNERQRTGPPPPPPPVPSLISPSADMDVGASNAATETTEAPPVDAAAAGETGVETAEEAAEPAPDLTAPLVVTLEFAGECWVEAWVDGERVLMETKVQGESYQLEAQREVELKLGDASVLRVEVNGMPYTVYSGEGPVLLRQRIDLDTVRRLSEAAGRTPS